MKDVRDIVTVVLVFGFFYLVVFYGPSPSGSRYADLVFGFLSGLSFRALIKGR